MEIPWENYGQNFINWTLNLLILTEGNNDRLLVKRRDLIMMGIYKFQNKTNGKIYIGQSIALENRYKDHFYNHKNQNLKDYNTKFYRALRKYGFENFTYEILEQSDFFTREELNEKEIKWIAYYNSYEAGYNSNKGGFKVTENGEEHPMAKLTNQQVLEIKHKLKTTTITQYQLAEEYHVTQSLIAMINEGRKWAAIGIQEKYPIREQGVARTGTKNHNSVLTEDQVMDMRKRNANGESRSSIFEDYKHICSRSTLDKTISGRCYSNLPVFKNGIWT